MLSLLQSNAWSTDVGQTWQVVSDLYETSYTFDWAGLRIRLCLADVPKLADLPWEYLHNPALNHFLVLSVETPLVRYLELPKRIQPLGG